MIQSLISLTLSNTLGALALAVATLVVTRFVRTPALAHALWIVVLVKLISPAIVELPVRLPGDRPLLALRVPEAHTPKVDPGVSSRLGETRPPGWAGLSETGGSESQRDSATLSSAEVANVRSGDSLFDVENSKSIVSLPEKLPRARHDDSETAEPNGVVFYRQVQVNWQQWLCAIWGSGIAIWFLVVALRMRRFRKWLKKTQPASAAIRIEFERLAREIRVGKVPELREADGACPPLTWAMWGRPVVLLPKSLIEILTSDERRVLLLHELAHLRRRDHWVRWLELVVTGLQWWQPLTWFARRNLHLASEQCCDAWVVRRFPELARTYAATLLKTVDFLADARAPLPIGATGFGDARQLKRRFEMILKECVTDRLSSKLWMGVSLIALIIMPLSVRAIWAEPTKHEDSQANVTTTTASDAGESKPSDAVARPPATIEERLPASSDSARSFDERMRRLEATVEKLARIVEASQAKNSDLHIRDSSSLPAQREETDKPTGIPSDPANSATKPTDPNAENPSPVPDVLLQELNNPANGRWWNQVVRDVDTKLALYKANSTHLVAAKRQCEAIKEAYDAGTVSFDLLLESQRTKVDADLSYVNSIFDLAPQSSDQKQHHLTLEKVRVYREARDLALQTWKEVHAKKIVGAKGGEPDRDAQAREQYFLYRTALQTAIADLTK